MFNYNLADLLSGGNVTKEDIDHDDSVKVYFLLDGGCVVYVGQSINLDVRIQAHSSKRFDNIAFISIPHKCANDVEAHYIIKFQPKYNKTIPTNNLFMSDKEIIKRISDIVSLELSLTNSEWCSSYNNGKVKTTRRFFKREVLLEIEKRLG